MFEWDPVLDTYVQSRDLGPISFRTPATIGRGRFSLRAGLSYLELSERFGPVDYEFAFKDDAGHPTQQTSYERIGLYARARVGVLNVSATYGWTDRIETSVVLPVTLVDLEARQTFLTGSGLQTSYLGVGSRADLDGAVASGSRQTRTQPLQAMGAPNLPTGNQLGFGRAGLLAKIVALATSRARVAFAPELYLPSPSEAEFAGTGTFSIFPRAVASLSPGVPHLRLFADVGYEYDFDIAPLRRFAWDVGGALSFPGLLFDAGVGGSKYDQGISWTTRSASAPRTGDLAPYDVHALGNTDVGTNLVDFLGGFRIQTSSRSVVGASILVPLTQDGFRPGVAGTLTGEYYF